MFYYVDKSHTEDAYSIICAANMMIRRYEIGISEMSTLNDRKSPLGHTCPIYCCQCNNSVPSFIGT